MGYLKVTPINSISPLTVPSLIAYYPSANSVLCF